MKKKTVNVIHLSAEHMRNIQKERFNPYITGHGEIPTEKDKRNNRRSKLSQRERCLIQKEYINR